MKILAAPSPEKNEWKTHTHIYTHMHECTHTCMNAHTLHPLLTCNQK